MGHHGSKVHFESDLSFLVLGLHDMLVDFDVKVFLLVHCSCGDIELASFAHYQLILFINVYIWQREEFILAEEILFLHEVGCVSIDIAELLPLASKLKFRGELPLESVKGKHRSHLLLHRLKLLLDAAHVGKR